MKIFLVRHGDALSEKVSAERPLSDKGKENVLKVANHLKEKNVSVDEIFHSGKNRARQTAEIISNTINPEAKLLFKKHLGPCDETDQIYEEITHKEKDIMVVGHLPFLGKLASRLVKGFEDSEVVRFAAGCAVAFEKDNDKKWKIAWSISP